MRPLRLELEGFSTFRSSTVFDFSGLDLLALTGPTGSGKSSVIDAIGFALYGSVTRYDNTAAVAPVIHQLAVEARVRLDFELAGRVYTAVRVVRRTTTGATTREARLERVEGVFDPDDVAATETTTLAGNVKELDAAVADLLGLDFDQFNRTVVLPQGAFAQFLKDKPADRQRLLRRLLDMEIYKHMGEMARSDAKLAAHRSEALAEELLRYPAVTAEERSGLQKRTEALAAARSVLTAELQLLDEKEARLGPLRERCNQIDGSRARLAVLSEAMTALPVEDLSEPLSRAEADLARLSDVASDARRRSDKAREAADAAGDPVALTQAVAALGRVAELAQERSQAVADAADLLAASQRAAEAARQAELESEQARLAQEAARRKAGAGEWTAALSIGEACPVCHQRVDELPADAVGHAEEALENAEARVVQAVTAAREAARAAADAEVRLEHANRQANETGAKIEELSVGLARDGRDPLSPSAVVDAEAALARAGQAAADRELAAAAAASAEAELARAESTVRNLRERAEGIRRRLGQLRDEVAELKPPPIDDIDPAGAIDRLGAWAASFDGDLAVERERLAAEGKTLAREKEEVDRSLRARLNELGLPSDAGSGSPLELLAVAETEAAHRLKAAEARQAEHDRLSVQVKELDRERALQEALGHHLQAKGFEAWLLDEALQVIVERATGWLDDLSQGQYALVAVNREFWIIDHANADERRNVRTLSGGETFLASLALALALADSVAELASVDAPALGSMFLDEGFGTLDPSTLDVVASAIEELAATGRMIGIVTHVTDLAERMPARFEIRKQAGGSTAELVHL